MSDAPVVPDSSEVLALDGDALTATHEFLGFVIAGENYGLPLRTVREILKVPPVTEVPRAAHDILGIISVRGRVTTVIDLRRRLHVDERPATKQSRILLVDEGEEVLGLLVDEVLQVFRLREDELELAAAVGGDTAEYVLGIGRPGSSKVGPRSGRGGDQNLQHAHDILILLEPQTLLRS
ncbi:MAG: chemotaxis protein CheW [Myxococcota bacterium]